MKMLLARDDVNPDKRTPLWSAAFHGHKGVLKLLLERGDVNPDQPDINGGSPLCCTNAGIPPRPVKSEIPTSLYNIDLRPSWKRYTHPDLIPLPTTIFSFSFFLGQAQLQVWQHRWLILKTVLSISYKLYRKW